MTRVAYILVRDMEEVTNDRQKMPVKDFIMNIFQKITKKVDLLKNISTTSYIIEEKQSYPAGSRKDDAVLSFDQLRT